ncbi:MAG: hypothetical protein WC001_13585 [Desulfurivibrionaceae bacterium]
MIWVFLIVTVVSSLLVKLGAVSVMAGLLLMALKVALLVIVLLVVLLLWRRFKKGGNQDENHP